MRTLKRYSPALLALLLLGAVILPASAMPLPELTSPIYVGTHANTGSNTFTPNGTGTNISYSTFSGIFDEGVVSELDVYADCSGGCTAAAPFMLALYDGSTLLSQCNTALPGSRSGYIGETFFQHCRLNQPEQLVVNHTYTLAAVFTTAGSYPLGTNGTASRVDCNGSLYTSPPTTLPSGGSCTTTAGASLSIFGRGGISNYVPVGNAGIGDTFVDLSDGELATYQYTAGGNLNAFQALAANSDQFSIVTSLNFFADSQTTASTFDIGLYADNNGQPGALLTHCNAPVNNITPGAGIQSCTVDPYRVQIGSLGSFTDTDFTDYWIGVLNTDTSASTIEIPAFRINPVFGGLIQQGITTNGWGATLPHPWSRAAAHNPDLTGNYDAAMWADFSVNNVLLPGFMQDPSSVPAQPPAANLGNAQSTTNSNTLHCSTSPNDCTTAWPFTATGNTTVNRIWFYSPNPAGSPNYTHPLYLGIYSDNGAGAPSTLLNFCPYTPPTFADSNPHWTSCDFTSLSLTAGTQYWISVAATTNPNVIVYTGTTSPNVARSSTSNNMPSPWANQIAGFSAPGPVSMFADFSAPVMGDTSLGGSQSVFTINGGNNSGGTPPTGQHTGVAEQLVASQSVTVNYIVGYINDPSNGLNEMPLGIASDSSNTYGTSLAECSTPGNATFGGSAVWAWKICKLSSPVTLTQGTKYWLYEGVSSSGNLNNNPNDRQGACANYDGGSGCVNEMGGAGTQYYDWPPGTQNHPTWGSIHATIGNMLIYVQQ